MNVTALERAALGFAGISGAVAVAMGAWAAHGLSEAFGAPAAELVRTASAYQLWHALALILAAFLTARAETKLAHFSLSAAVVGFALGQILFCGSLYGLAFGLPRFLGAVAPLGGLAFILTWLCLVVAAVAGRSRSP